MEQENSKTSTSIFSFILLAVIAYNYLEYTSSVQHVSTTSSLFSVSQPSQNLDLMLPTKVKKNQKILFYIAGSDEINSFNFYNRNISSANATYPKIYNKCKPNFINDWKYQQHGDDILWYETIHQHPWRTYNLTEAKIIILPVIFSLAIHSQKLFHKKAKEVLKGCNWQNPMEYLRKNFESFSEEEYFKNPKVRKKYIFLIVSSDWTLRVKNNVSTFPDIVYQMFPYFKIGNYEIQNHTLYNFDPLTRYDAYTQAGPMWNCTIVTPYVDKSQIYNQPNLKSQLTFEKWKQRHYNFVFMGRMGQQKTSYILRNQLGVNMEDMTIQLHEKYVNDSNNVWEFDSNKIYKYIYALQVCARYRIEFFFLAQKPLEFPAIASVNAMVAK